ncbi:MAG: radical SAM protein, partial [Clostridia bacterium]|nr:radical SAM protein [Clostridia bacterium]
PHDCVFCNQKRITGASSGVTAEDVKNAVEVSLKTLPKMGRRVEVAFFGGSFTGIPIEEQTELLAAANEYVKSGSVDGIRLSTRPDYITPEILDNLKKYGVTTIELGVQSLDDEVLLKSNRGHTQEDVINAVNLIRKYPFTLGLQMMTGLPGDTAEKSIQTAEKIIALKPDIVRIYPTLTIKDTRLEEMLKTGEYVPQSLREAVDLCAELVSMFEKNNITVIRVGLQATDEISESGDSVVAGPLHSAFGELVESKIYLGIILNALKDYHSDNAKIYVAPTEISKATGNKKCNIQEIKKATGIDIKICADDTLHKREVKAVAVKTT